MVKKLLHRRTSVFAQVNFECAFFVTTKVFCALVYAGIYVSQRMCRTHLQHNHYVPHIFATQSLQVVHMCGLCMCSLFLRVGGGRCGCSAGLCRALVAWRGGLFLTDGEMGCCLVCCLFLTRVGVYVCVCACIRTHTHTHTAHTVLDLYIGVRTRRLEGPKNPD